MDRTSKALDVFGNDTVEFARKNLNLSGAYRKKNRKVNASGDLSKGLGFDKIIEKNGYVIEFTSKENYAADVESGRRKGIMPPSKALVKYIKSRKQMRLFKNVQRNGTKVSKSIPKNDKNDKNIKSAAFAMAVNIKKKGIEPAPFFSDGMDKAYEKNKDALGDAIALDLEDIIFNNFQKNGGVS